MKREEVDLADGPLQSFIVMLHACGLSHARSKFLNAVKRTFTVCRRVL